MLTEHAAWNVVAAVASEVTEMPEKTALLLLAHVAEGEQRFALLYESSQHWLPLSLPHNEMTGTMPSLNAAVVEESVWATE